LYDELELGFGWEEANANLNTLMKCFDLGPDPNNLDMREKIIMIADFMGADMDDEFMDEFEEWERRREMQLEVVGKTEEEMEVEGKKKREEGIRGGREKINLNAKEKNTVE
jgi:hypothetical protein